MLKGGYDENFLRYLAAHVPLSVFENRILSPLEGSFSRERVRHAVGGRGLNKLHLYVSVPFCAEDCSYCHCTHYIVRKRPVLASYEDYLVRQAAFFAREVKAREVSSVYFGGGTPSLFSEQALDRIFSLLASRFDCRNAADIIFEGHPSSLGRAKLSLLKERGVTRLTIGVQSLEPRVLRAMGRRQTPEAAFRCIDEAKRQGIRFVNVDLIAGLPGQSAGSFLKGLKQVIAMAPEGIHVNPFSDVLTSRCHRDRALDFRALVAVRQKTLFAARDLLERSGYFRKGFEAYQRSPGADNVQQTGYLDGSGDILGIGMDAQSIFAGRAVIRDVSMTSGAVAFRGSEIDGRYTMANHMFLHLLKGCAARDFAAVFGRSLQEVFGRELGFLEKEGIVRWDGDTAGYAGPWTPAGLFEYFSLARIFLGPRFLGRLKTLHRACYDPGHVYTFARDGFMSKMNDAFFLLTLYEMGY